MPSNKKRLVFITSDPYNPVIKSTLQSLSEDFKVSVLTDCEYKKNYEFNIISFCHRYSSFESISLLFSRIIFTKAEKKFPERNVYRRNKFILNILFYIKLFFSKLHILPTYSQIIYALFKNFSSHDDIFEDIDFVLTDANLRHVRFLNPLIARVAKLNIPLYSLIYSWDNTQYSTLNTFSDKYFVWNQINKSEFIKYYKVDSNKIDIVGSLMCDYLKENDIDKIKNQATENNLLKTKKLRILYPCVFGGDDYVMLFEEAKFIKNLYDILNANLNEFTLTIRTYPSTSEQDIYKELENYKNLDIYRHKNFETISRLGNKETISFSKNHEKIKSMTDSDILISNGSTMTLEYAHLNKPIIHLNANAFKKTNTNKLLFNRLFLYGHLEHLCIEKYDKNVVTNFNEMIASIKKYNNIELLRYNEYLKNFCNPTKDLAKYNVKNKLKFYHS